MRARSRRSCATSFRMPSSSPSAARCGYGPRPNPEADTVTFTVRDTGIGIEPADLELIFQEFGQVAHRAAIARQGNRTGSAALEEAGGTARWAHRRREHAWQGIDLLGHPAAIVSRRRWRMPTKRRRAGTLSPAASRYWWWKTIPPTCSPCGASLADTPYQTALHALDTAGPADPAADSSRGDLARRHAAGRRKLATAASDCGSRRHMPTSRWSSCPRQARSARQSI